MGVRGDGERKVRRGGWGNLGKQDVWDKGRLDRRARKHNS